MAINRNDLVPVFIKADTEDQLQAKLFDISLDMAKDLQVISIYTRGSKVVAWLKVDRKLVEVTSIPKKEKVSKKKKAKK